MQYLSLRLKGGREKWRGSFTLNRHIHIIDKVLVTISAVPAALPERDRKT